MLFQHTVERRGLVYIFQAVVEQSLTEFVSILQCVKWLHEFQIFEPIMNSQDEQHINIKFCIRLQKSVIETIKLMSEAHSTECMAEWIICKWQSTFSKKLE